MQHTTSPLTPSLPSLLVRLRQHMRPFVQELASFAPFTGAVLFVPDRHHSGTAGAVSVVNADRRADMLAFTNTNVAQHRVDLSGSELGRTFSTQKSIFARSRLNPARHVVYGIPIVLNAATPAVIQLAFDTKTPGMLPSGRAIRSAWDSNKQEIILAGGDVVRAADNAPSLGDVLLLDVPTAPNAAVIKWDVVRSTSAADREYPLFRDYLNAMGMQMQDIAASYGGSVVAHTGDGQNIVLPFSGDSASGHKASLTRFAQHIVMPCLREMLNKQDALRGMYGLEVRIAAGIGHVERSVLGETTGPVFFELAALLKRPSQPAGVLYSSSFATVLRGEGSNFKSGF